MTKAKALRALVSPFFRTDGAGVVKVQTIVTCVGPVRVLIYPPSTPKTTYPLYLNLHGGGFILGFADIDNFFCRGIADRTGAVVVSVAYAKAPEKPWPTALEEIYEVVRWLSDTSPTGGATQLSLDGRLAMGGFSAGGNLILALMLKLLQDKDMDLSPLLLASIYPLLDLQTDFWTKMTQAPPKARYDPISTRLAQFFIECYCPNPADRIHPTCSPALADPALLARFPRTLLMVGDKDALMVETEAFKTALENAGVAVRYRLFRDAVHAFTHKNPHEYGYNEEAKREAFEMLVREVLDVYEGR